MGRNWICRCVVAGAYWEAALKVSALSPSPSKASQLLSSSQRRYNESHLDSGLFPNLTLLYVTAPPEAASQLSSPSLVAHIPYAPCNVRAALYQKMKFFIDNRPVIVV